MKLKEIDVLCNSTPYVNSYSIDEAAKKIIRALKEDMRANGNATYTIKLERK